MLLGVGTRSLFGGRFFRQEIGKVFCPVHVEGRTIRPYPVLLRASRVEPRGQARGPSENASLWGDIPAKSWCIHPRLRPWSSAAGISFPKTTALFGIVDIHDFYPRSPFYFKGLSKNQLLHAMQNYHITI
jgi:hypothetical protein